MKLKVANEKIYTIRITEAMNEKCGCPLCTVEKRTERDEIERILGASMMEPDVRVKTNEQGFCEKHLELLLKESNRLSLALMLQTHLTEHAKKLYAGCVPLMSKTPDPKKQVSVLEKNKNSCYLCTRINEFMSATLSTFLYMYKSDEGFDERIKEQPYICTKHTRLLFEQGQKALPKDVYKNFCNTVNDINLKYASSLIEDIDWFCKKFDYRYRNEDWKNSKDSCERAAAFLRDSKEG